MALPSDVFCTSYAVGVWVLFSQVRVCPVTEVIETSVRRPFGFLNIPKTAEPAKLCRYVALVFSLEELFRVMVLGYPCRYPARYRVSVCPGMES